MHNIGVWIWVIIVLFGVINSIRKKAAQSQAAMRVQVPAPQPQYQPVPPAPQPLTAPPAAPVYTAAAAYVPAVARPVATASVAPRPLVAPAAPSVEPPPRPARTIFPLPVSAPSGGVLDGLFEDSRSIVRGIVIAEVLGKPKALSEQPFWSLPPSVR